MKKYKKCDLKGIILNVLAVAIIVSITVAMPVVAKSSSWNMTLYHCVCDGYDNGVLYSADAGDDIEVTGTVTVVAKAKGALKKSNATYCIIYRKPWFGYEKLATQKLDSFKEVGDGFDLKGSGTITID